MTLNSTKLVFILLIIYLANGAFYIIPIDRPEKLGADAALVLTFAFIFYYILIERVDFKQLNNFAFWYVFLYLAMVITQVSVASFFYEQTIIDGLIVARSQFIYLFLLVLLWSVKTEEDFRLLMAGVTCLAVFAVFLGLFNYFGKTIFYHKWALGHGVRSGVTRAFIPGMEIIVCATIWQVANLLSRAGSRIVAASVVTFLFSAIIFRQTKMQLLATVSSVSVLMVFFRRWSLVFAVFASLLLASTVLSVATGQNIVVKTVVDAYEAVFEKTGDRTTWTARLEQMQGASGVLEDTFLTGSGGIVLRGGEDGLSDDLHSIRRGMDLGYFNWIKFYGLPGLVLMGFLYLSIAWILLKVRAEQGHTALYAFALGQFMVVGVSMLTIDYFRTARTLPILCLLLTGLAVLLNLAKERNLQRG